MCDQGSLQWWLYKHNPSLPAPTTVCQKKTRQWTQTQKWLKEKVWKSIERFSNQIGFWVGVPPPINLVSWLVAEILRLWRGDKVAGGHPHPRLWDHTGYWLEIGNSLLIGEFYHIIFGEFYHIILGDCIASFLGNFITYFSGEFYHIIFSTWDQPLQLATEILCAPFLSFGKCVL